MKSQHVIHMYLLMGSCLWYILTRQLALKALNERLSKPETAPSWPSMDDDGPASPSGSQVSTPSVTPPSVSPAAPPKLPVPSFKENTKAAQSSSENV